MSIVTLRLKTRHTDTITVVDGDEETARAMARMWVGEPLDGGQPRVERVVSRDGKTEIGWWCERHSDFGIRRAVVQVLGIFAVDLL